jgi:hypothetical protein
VRNAQEVKRIVYAADCITATNGERLEELFADWLGMWADRKSSDIGEDSDSLATGLFRRSHRHQIWSPRSLRNFLDALTTRRINRCLYLIEFLVGTRG